MRREDILTDFGFGVQLEDCAILFVGVSKRNPNHFRVARPNLVTESITIKLLVEVDETEKMTNRSKHTLADMVSIISSQTYS